MRTLVVVLVTLTLSGCASAQSRLRGGLVKAGVREPVAGCMASRMADDLSVFQLRRIGALGNFKDEDLRQMPIDRVLYNIRALRDPEILAAASTAAAICAVVMPGSPRQD